ncbi:flippase [Cupriavidus pauculus]|uniref:Flippase n=1 Tax=Cupriavidus pauculus TaxID=82633 RepID=A0A5P2H405_9BURK|nr:flippase [Cupriavidus pauculus]QET02606.1 flippase [Cupriavidus pauculus]
MLLRHTTFNLIGLGAPLLVAIVTIPPLIAALGPSRFGLLTMVWAVVSYFGLFDLGLGRALTQQLSLAFARGDDDSIGPLTATATVLMAVLGVVAGIALALGAPWGVDLIKSVPDRGEAIRAVYAMAFAMPSIILTSGFRGVLEAKSAFGIVNAIRLPLGLFTFLGPLAVVWHGNPGLDVIALVLALGRMVGCVVHAVFAWRVLTPTQRRLHVGRAEMKQLASSGGWLTVSNIISPIMGYVDRFVIGAVVSASAVAYYATPNEMVTKIWIIPGAVTAVLFPAFAARMADPDADNLGLVRASLTALYITVLPITAVLVLFGNELLTLWINAEFASHSTLLLQIFAVSILINCMAQIPYTLIQSAGQPRTTALLHCGILPIYLLSLWLLARTFGVTGAAWAWLLRMVIDACTLFFLSAPILRQPRTYFINRHVVTLSLLAALTFAGALFDNPWLRVLWVSIGIGLAVLCTKPVAMLMAYRARYAASRNTGS